MNENLFHVSVKALILSTKGEILVLQKDPSRRSGLNPMHWDLPGGRIKGHDDLVKTLKREVREEIGITDLKVVNLFDAAVSPFKVKSEKGIVGLVLFTFLCQTKTTKIKITDGEHLDWKWCTKQEAIKLLKPKFGQSLIDKLKEF